MFAGSRLLLPVHINCVTHTYLVYTSIAHNIPVHTKLSIVIYLYIQLYICILLFLIYLLFFILLFIISFLLLLFFHCHYVALWSFCHENKFLVCVNIPGNKADSDSEDIVLNNIKLDLVKLKSQNHQSQL